jgi:hypothetical protein
MTVTVLGILTFVVIVLISGLILVTVTFSKSLQKALDHADRIHDRADIQIASLLDRLMARSLEDFKVYDLGETSHGEVIYPEGDDRPWNVPGQVQPRGGLAGGDKPIGVDEEVDDEAG